MSKTIMKKVVGVASHSYMGVLSATSKFVYELSVSKLETQKNKVEVKEAEQYTVREEKLRPFNDGSLNALELGKLQKKIDAYLEKNPISEALKEVENDGKKSYAISAELKFQVERYLEEKTQSRDVVVMKEVEELGQKEVGTIKFYFRPTGGQVSKSITNFIKSK